MTSVAGPVLGPGEVRPSKLLQNLFMNWWTPSEFMQPSSGAHRSLQRTFWMQAPPEGITILPALSAVQYDLAVSSVAIMPPQQEIRLVFRPDFSVLGKDEGYISIQRFGGIRLIDVVDAMHLW